MERKEVLDILSLFNEQLDRMTDEELYDYMMESSSSFRKTVSDLDEFIVRNDDGSVSVAGSTVVAARIVIDVCECSSDEMKNLIDTAKAGTDIESSTAYVQSPASNVTDKGFEIPGKPRKGDEVWAMVA